MLSPKYIVKISSSCLVTYFITYNSNTSLLIIGQIFDRFFPIGSHQPGLSNLVPDWSTQLLGGSSDQQIVRIELVEAAVKG